VGSKNFNSVIAKEGLTEAISIQNFVLWDSETSST